MTRLLCWLCLCAAAAGADPVGEFLSPPWPLGVGQRLVEDCAYAPVGGQAWEVLPQRGLAAEACLVRRTLSGLLCQVSAPGRVLLRRKLEQSVSGQRWLVVYGQAVGAMRVQVSAVTDAGEVGPVAPDEQGLAVLPLAAQRLTTVQIELVANPQAHRGRVHTASYELQWLTLREPERVGLTLHAFGNRAVLVSWTRPFWGAERYLVCRDRQPTADPARSPAVNAGRSGSTPWLIDTPPVSGRWAYAVAPIEGRRPGQWAQADCTLSAQPVPTIGLSDLLVHLDGELSEWARGHHGPAIALSARNGHVLPADQPGAADRAAVVRLFRNDVQLYLAAEVTDSHLDLAHDGLELRLGTLRLDQGHFAGRYGLTCDYRADGQAALVGQYAVRRAPGGYAIEAALPLNELRARGIEPESEDWLLLGLALRHGAPAGWVSWNARARVDDPAEAALVRLAH